MVSVSENSSVFGTKIESVAETVPAVERALDVLELLETSETRLTLSEIAAHLGLPKGSAHRLLNTLRMRGYIEQVSSGGSARGGGFGLGVRLVPLAARAQARLDVVRASESPLRRLAEATGEGCQLSLRSGRQAVCIVRVAASSHPEVSLMGGVGSSFPLHAVAVGKVLLAYAPASVQTAYLAGSLAAFTPNTITDPAALAEELSAIRTRGMAEDAQEYKLGLRALAAPIFDAGGHICAAVALPLLVGAPLSDEQERQRETELRRAAADTARALGYREG